MKTYKYLFWITFISFIVFLGYSYMKKIECELSINMMEWNIIGYEHDIRIINTLALKTDQSKHQIDSVLIALDPSDGDYFKITKDTSFLNNTYLIYKDDQLKSIELNY